ncbi:hypothetical protein CEUSTIGMA_g8031.t1 [Chlamydomonas eustigma]|uniref:AMP-activated protein kinase glycogen-binding domain-containing protein n=1 Tax=Chlamydomonas eustigma TaxID=1157962 RepID=A0A250XBY2_9CHLO|nr:hypothetical protein CEUSTIGMA_g8031.t1 [Chlamydomonas eustigma]|eukprot:GAX80595.1 hypothetical protein CEUSTIGMA_g8031.t1 [Chlamydomonas eustigma]
MLFNRSYRPHVRSQCRCLTEPMNNGVLTNSIQPELPIKKTGSRDGKLQSSVNEKLALIQQLKQRSQQATASTLVHPIATPVERSTRLIDERMYQASVEARQALSEKLSEANMYASVLEAKLEECYEDLEVAMSYMKKVSREFGTTSRLAESTAAAVRFGVDKEDAVEKLVKLSDRLAQLEQAVQSVRDSFSARVPQRVPVTWVGVASEVRLVGDFDEWTRGVELSASEIDFDGSIRTFEAVVPLLPGCYRVKFMVDGQWRLAPEWPTENDSMGETNNLLLVS